MEKVTEREVRDLEDRASYIKGERARALRAETEAVMARAEALGVGEDLIDGEGD
jgi:hypothetical protein